MDAKKNGKEGRRRKGTQEEEEEEEKKEGKRRARQRTRCRGTTEKKIPAGVAHDV